MHSQSIQSPALKAVRLPDVDRFFFAGMCLLFLIVAVAGFAPRSAAILNGQMPSPPLSVHVHAALMVIWLLLQAVQGSLIAGRQRGLHVALGLGSFMLVPLIVVLMLFATLDTYALMQSVGAGDMASNIVILQVRSMLLFALFFFWAYKARHNSLDTHKRLMLMTTLLVLDAAIARMDWLPGIDLEAGIAPVFAYQLLLLVPAFAYDWSRLGRIHGAWLKALMLYLPWIVLTIVLWNNPWWLDTAPGLMGF